MVTNRGKIHGGKSVLNVHVASGEFGEITRGETTRFYCTSKLFTIYFSRRCSFCPPSDITLSVFFWHQKLGFFMTRLLLSSFDLSSSIAGSTLVLQYVICISLKPSVMSFYTFFTNLRIVCKTGKLNAHMLVVSQFVNLVLSDP